MDSEDVRRQWAERSGAYSPAYYAHHGPDERSEAVRSLVGRYVDRAASVLELGCSSGRHLAHLQAHGFEDLSGIDVNDDAFEVMADAYPDLAAAGTFYHDPIEAVVGEFADDRFDVVFSVETLQHLHPDSTRVLEELRRITDDLLVTVENEGEADPDNGGAGWGRCGAESTDGGTGSEDDAGGTDAGGPESDDRAGDPDVAGAGTVDGREVGEDLDDDFLRSAVSGVNYVTDDLPLYYRDWNRVFTGLGFDQVAAERGERDTVRAFRPPRRSSPGADRP